MNQSIFLHIEEHHGKQRLFAKFPYKKELAGIIKTIPGATWSQSKKQWHFNLNRRVVQLIHDKCKSLSKLDLSVLKKQLIEKKQKVHDEKFSEIDLETTKAIDYFKLWMAKTV